MREIDHRHVRSRFSNHGLHHADVFGLRTEVGQEGHRGETCHEHSVDVRWRNRTLRPEKPARKCDGAGANPPMAPALSALPLRARLPAESAGGLVTCDIP